MYETKNTSSCSMCCHRKVCSLKDELLLAQKAVDDISIALPGKPEDEKNAKLIPICDINWIEPIILSCIHFTKEWTGGIRK